jgi:hypothetical protein
MKVIEMLVIQLTWKKVKLFLHVNYVMKIIET